MTILDTILICSDCAIAAANDDYSGMDDATAARVFTGLEFLPGYLVVGEEAGFSHAPCECCSALAGDRHEAHIYTATA